MLVLGAPFASDGVQFINEDDSRLFLPCGSEEFPDALSARADEDLVEFRARKASRQRNDGNITRKRRTQMRRGKEHQLHQRLPLPT